jgi:hypothetical protein
MKHKGQFQKDISAAAKRMYGPKVILVCGYPEDEHEPFLSFLKKTKITDFPAVFAVQTDLKRQVREIIDQNHKSGFMHSSPMPRAVIMCRGNRKGDEQPHAGIQKGALYPSAVGLPDPDLGSLDSAGTAQRTEDGIQDHAGQKKGS